MGTLTRSEIAERLAELKRTNVPRASLKRLGIAVAVEPDDLRDRVERHLRHFAWLEGATPPHKPGTIICPGCNTRGWFAWGIVHGSGSCSCGWPGTLYHFIRDDEGETLLRFEVLLWAHPYEVKLSRRR